MKSSKISTLTACTMLLLTTGLLFGCKPIMDPKPLPGKSKETTTESAPSEAAVAEPAPAIDAIESIESLESDLDTFAEANKNTEALVQADEQDAATAEMGIAELESTATPSEAEVPVLDDGDDVVKATPAIIRNVQQALVDAGFNPGPVDGVSGAKTVTALESFQKQHNIPAGPLTKRTLRALGVNF